MKKVSCLKNMVFMCVMMIHGGVNAQDVTQIGRYATVSNKALQSQINPLLAIQQVHFNTEIHTVGDALHHWLSLSGYELVSEEEQAQVLVAVLKKTLPQVDRDLGPLSIQDGLEVLVGKGIFKLVVDPLNRYVNFKLLPQYAQFNKKPGAKA